MEVFIEAIRGSRDKGVFNEETGERIATRTALLPYPYPYGFITGTPGGDDGDCLDCYVITMRSLAVGGRYTCEPVGLLEMFEDGEEDHKILARLADEPEAPGSTGNRQALRDGLAAFITGIFTAYPEAAVSVGALRSAGEAEQLVRSRSGPV
ncbi:MAG: hypothetical protein E4H20_11625 [Spirochaetales bacterium]|nr:MAG: hypothetical protein E4H20_11625 [Spirochaetales bacterium]